MERGLEVIIEKHLAVLDQKYPELSECKAEIYQGILAWVNCFRAGGKLLLAGNGGSAADCDHIVGELMKSFVRRRALPRELLEQLQKQFPAEVPLYQKHLQQGLPAISLSAHPALNSAYCNDEEPSLVYAQQVLGYGQKGDVILGISTSGNSASVCHALRLAKARGLVTIGLTGAKGGHFCDLVSIVIRVPRFRTAEIQELHLPVYHCMCLAVEEIFFPE